MQLLSKGSNYTWNVILSDGIVNVSALNQFNFVTSTYVTGVDDKIDLIPKKFSISQNYPNPFNPVTKINYSIPRTSSVSLKIYDILGREIKTLVEEVKVAGYYEINFDGSNLSSGVYFYRIQAGGFVETKKLILMK